MIRYRARSGRKNLSDLLLFSFIIIQHPEIIVRIQDEVLVLRTYYNSYLGTDKARSALWPPRN